MKKSGKVGAGEYEVASAGDLVRQQTLDLEAHLDLELQREKYRVRRKISYAVVMLAAIYILSIFAFHNLENWSWEDSLYFTTSTITTVGYGDLVPHSYYGRLFTIPLMLVGVGIGLYVIYAVQDYGRTKLDMVAKHVDRISDIANGKKKL